MSMAPKEMLAPRPLDPTKLAMLSRGRAADAANLALFQLQGKTPEEMVMGSAILFATMAKSCGLDPEKLHTMANRVLMAPEEGDRVAEGSLQVLRDFASIRVMGRETTIA